MDKWFLWKCRGVDTVFNFFTSVIWSVNVAVRRTIGTYNLMYLPIHGSAQS